MNINNQGLADGSVTPAKLGGGLKPVYGTCLVSEQQVVNVASASILTPGSYSVLTLTSLVDLGTGLVLNTNAVSGNSGIYFCSVVIPLKQNSAVATKYRTAIWDEVLGSPVLYGDSPSTLSNGEQTKSVIVGTVGFNAAHTYSLRAWCSAAALVGQPANAIYAELYSQWSLARIGG